MMEFTFVEARKHHFKEIVEIHNSNVLNPNISNNQGFLLTQISEAEIVQSLDNSHQYFVLTNSHDEVLGFLTVWKPTISNEFLDEILWEDVSYRDKILDERHLYIKVLATRKTWMGKGVAQLLYASLYEKFPRSFLSAFIVAKPVFNERSLIFHQKQGFKQIGTFRRDRFLDLQNYECVLVFKETQ